MGEYCRVRSAGRPIGLLLVAISAAAMMMVPDDAAARAKPKRRGSGEPLAAAPPRAEPSATVPRRAVEQPAPILAVVSIADQRISVYGAGGLIARAPVSTGTPGYSTPTGLFSILQKNRYHESNIYSGAPMPFMQRITWSGVALHQGHLPGYPASHGCIRMPEVFAQQLWGMTRVGQRVIVASRDVGVDQFAHELLPAPVLQAAPQPAAAADAVSSAGGGSVASFVHRVSGVPAGASEPRLLNPIEYAQALRITAQREAVEAVHAAKAALANSADVSAQAQRAADFKRERQRAVATIEARLAAIARSADQGTHRDSLEATLALGEELEHELEEAEDRLAFAVAAEQEASDAAFAAARAARDAEALVETTAEASRAAARRIEPVSVFISRKEGRVFIRQGFVPVLDAPVTILDPGRPLGTHLLVAMQPAGGADKGLAWVAATVPSAPASSVIPSAAGRGARPPRAPADEASLAPDTAAGALARIELPSAVRQLIAERVWVGAAITITDHGHSAETGRATDFIVLTR